MRKKPIRLIAAILVLLLSLVALSTLITSIQIVDRDDDGLQDSVEKRIHTDPLNPDTDADDFADGAEYTYWATRSAKEHRPELAPTGDVDKDGLLNVLDYDSDNDRLSDGKELEMGTDPANPDTDNDGLSDGDELLLGTDPLNPDTNGNGILDGDEGSGQSGENYRYTDEYSRTRTLIRNGNSGNVTCLAVFNPSLQGGDRLKRGLAYDAINADYTAYVAQPKQIPLELSDVEYEMRFLGQIPLADVTTQPIAIPSVSPTANIISYSSSVPDLSFQFFKDGADNYYAAASRYSSVHTVQLTIVTTANLTYFHPYDTLISEILQVNQIPEAMRHTPPQSVCEKAGLVIGELGLTGETNVKRILTRMVQYFSNFTEGDIPTPEQEPDIYLAIALAQHGACYPRSFAFFITANAIGIPTRLVVNDCHAFVEVYIPPYGWEMIDLGGLGICISCNPNGFDVWGSLGSPGTGGSGSDGGGQEGGDGEGAQKLPTFITITSVSPSADKKGTFRVEGVVSDAQNTGLQNIDVVVSLNRTKNESGVSAGQGRTKENGVFQILCIVPGDTEVGENQVVAHAKGNTIYSGSWTDPSILIYTNTTLVLTMARSIGLGEKVFIEGTLTDVGNLPVEGAILKISWNGSQIGQVTTDGQGYFNLTYTPASTLGWYHISVVYSGDQYRRGSQVETTLHIKDKGTRLQMTVTPSTVERNQSIFIEGILTSSTNETMNVAALNISCNGIIVSNASTREDGTFDTAWTIPRTVPPSNITICVRYPGTDLFAEAEDEQTICVQSKTFLTILLPIATTINQNTTVVMAGNVTDDQDEPVRNVHVAITGNDISRNATTDENGRFNASIYFPLSFPPGKTTVRIAFEGTGVYLPSQIQKEFIIVEVGPSYLPVIIALAVTLGSIAGVILILRARKRKKHHDIQRSLEEIITEALSRLQTETDHRKTVLDCYKKMCELLLRKGVIKDATQTPREFALAARAYLRVPPENLYDFTKVFEKARYSSREVNEKDREKAIRCLRKIVFAQVQGRRAVKTPGVSA